MSYFIVLTKYNNGEPIVKMSELEVESENDEIVNFYDPVWRSLKKSIAIRKTELDMKRISSSQEGAIKLWKAYLISDIKQRSYALNQLCELLDQDYFPIAERKEIEEELFDRSI